MDYQGDVVIVQCQHIQECTLTYTEHIFELFQDLHKYVLQNYNTETFWILSLLHMGKICSSDRLKWGKLYDSTNEWQVALSDISKINKMHIIFDKKQLQFSYTSHFNDTAGIS